MTGCGEQAAEVPSSHWVGATDELLLAEYGSSLVALSEAICAHLQALSCHGSGLLLLIDTATNTRVDTAKVSMLCEILCNKRYMCQVWPDF